MNLIKVINTVTPSFDDIRKEVENLQKSYPNKSNDELSKLYSKRIRNKYTSVGVASALPSTIPGFGTAAQIAIETGNITADLALMLRWMGSICYGTALIYDKNIESQFDQEFVKILGIWCGIVQKAKLVTVEIGAKAAQAQFNKNVSGKMLQKINKAVGKKIFTKYGSMKSSIALGKLIPMGVGAILGGTFNYLTMHSFGKAANEYFRSEEQEYIVIEG